jgi:hypothetical protein
MDSTNATHGQRNGVTTSSKKLQFASHIPDMSGQFCSFNQIFDPTLSLLFQGREKVSLSAEPEAE